jgi:hypothetical protein
MNTVTQELETLIAQTAAISWEDPSSQLETIPLEQAASELIPLVGHIISQRTQNNQTVNGALIKAWFFANPFSFAVLGPNMFLFKFTDKEHISKILGQVWNVNGYLLALQQWSPNASLGDLSLKPVPFWIQIHGLPLNNMSLKNSIAIGKGVGNILKIDSTNGVDSTFRTFLRLQVKVDVSKLLNSGFLFTKKDNSTTWISLKYERLDIYCTECGMIGHKESSCTAPQANRFPSRYKISLLVNIFSNLPPNKPHYPENHFNPSSTPRITPTQPFETSTPPHATLQNDHCSSQPPLTAPNHSPLPHTSTSAASLAQATPPQNTPHLTTLTSVGKDTPLKSTLKALSLFQKPTQLFSENQLSSTNRPTISYLPDANLEDSHIKPNKPIPSEKVHLSQNLNHPGTSQNITASSSELNSNSPAKVTAPSNKPKPSINIKRNSPYNIRPPKKPSITITETPTSSSYCPQNNPPPLQNSKKRTNTSVLASPSKRIAEAYLENSEAPNPTQSLFPVFSLGSSEKMPARSLFKAARKGKNKLISAVVDFDLSSVKKEGLLKHSKNQ